MASMRTTSFKPNCQYQTVNVTISSWYAHVDAVPDTFEFPPFEDAKIGLPTLALGLNARVVFDAKAHVSPPMTCAMYVLSCNCPTSLQSLGLIKVCIHLPCLVCVSEAGVPAASNGSRSIRTSTGTVILIPSCMELVSWQQNMNE